MLTIIDYGMGNLYSLCNALDSLKIQHEISCDIKQIKQAQKLILPGVGAFPMAMQKLNETGIAQAIIDKTSQGTPIFGICLGMQLLFKNSFEHEKTSGLGLVPGDIKLICANGQKVPHMGWNTLNLSENSWLPNSCQGGYVYFVHSYAASAQGAHVAATAHHGENFCAVVGSKNIYGTQFHPEKSGTLGLEILQTFANME